MTAAATVARIGPNAISRTLEALREQIGSERTDALLRRAGLERYRDRVPAAMVPEDDVIALYAAMHAELGRGDAGASAYRAGRATGDYLLAHRIPRAAQAALRCLPARLSAPLLLAAIGKHTWTFAGSGIVRTFGGRPVTIAIERCPICRALAGDPAPACAYYAGTFERLFRALVSRRTSVAEVTCAAMGAARCAFEIRY